MVTKKPVVKSKSARSTAREVARPKSEVKKHPPVPLKKLVVTKPVRAEAHVKAPTKAVALKPAARAKPVAAKPVAAEQAAAVAEAVRGRPGRKPNQSEEQPVGTRAESMPCPRRATTRPTRACRSSRK